MINFKQWFCKHDYMYLGILYFGYNKSLKLICKKCNKIKTKDLGWWNSDDHKGNNIMEEILKDKYK